MKRILTIEGAPPEGCETGIFWKIPLGSGRGPEEIVNRCQELFPGADLTWSVKEEEEEFMPPHGTVPEGFYLVHRTREPSEMVDRPPFGPGFDASDIHDGAEMLVFGSPVTYESGEDHTIFLIYDREHNLLAKKTMAGY